MLISSTSVEPDRFGMRASLRRRHLNRIRQSGPGTRDALLLGSDTSPSSGGGGIRTHGDLATTTVFETVRFVHSRTPPTGRRLHRAVPVLGPIANLGDTERQWYRHDARASSEPETLRAQCLRGRPPWPRGFSGSSGSAKLAPE